MWFERTGGRDPSSCAILWNIYCAMDGFCGNFNKSLQATHVGRYTAHTKETTVGWCKELAIFPKINQQ